MSFKVSQIDIETDIHPTESKDKVQSAIRNLFPDATFEKDGVRVLRATAKGLDTIQERIANQQIRDSARRLLEKGARKDHLFFILSKQAAFAGRVSFSNDGPLGDLVVIVRTDGADEVVEYLTRKERRDPGMEENKAPPED